MSSEQQSIIEGGGGPGRLDRFTPGRPAGRFTAGRAAGFGVGLGCALAGFALLLAAQVLPWISVRTTPLQQDFPTSTGGRLERGLGELLVPTDMFNLGWLVVLAAVATALAVPPSARRVVTAAGLGLVAGQLALLVGLTRGIQDNGALRGGFPQIAVPVNLEAGLYSAYGALVLFVLALVLAGGVPGWLRRSGPTSAPAAPAGPADLTVTPAPPVDPTVWSQPRSDIEVGGQPRER
jgi:hypothetical protein